MRTTLVAAVVVAGFIAWQAGAAHGQQAGQQGGRGRGAAAQVPNAPTDKTAFWSADDIQARWRENEALKRDKTAFWPASDIEARWKENEATLGVVKR